MKNEQHNTIYLEFCFINSLVSLSEKVFSFQGKFFITKCCLGIAVFAMSKQDILTNTQIQFLQIFLYLSKNLKDLYIIHTILLYTNK